MRVIAVIFLLCFFAPASYPQSGSNAERAFINALNELVTNSIQHHWYYDVPMQPDSLFHLTGDTISITWKMNTGDGWVRRRFAAAIAAIKSVDWDLNLVLSVGRESVVRVYEQTQPEPGWSLIEETHLLHIAPVTAEKRRQMKKKKKIERAFARMISTRLP